MDISGIENALYNRDQILNLELEHGVGSTGLPSDARHMAAMNELSKTIAKPISKISEPLGTFVGDTGAFAAGLINEIPGVYRSIKGEAPIKDVWEDIAANWRGSYGTPNITTPEEIYKDVYGIPSIDPTGKNLFTQYYEDDPYAGIEGQTAFLDPVSLYALLKTGTTKKKIGQYLLKNKLQSETGKKIGPKLRRKIRLAQGEKFEGSGIFKNIATGSKDYGPYAKPTTKPYIAPLGPRGEAREQIPTPPKKTYVSPARPHSADPPSSSGGAVSTGAGRNPWGRADGGLIDFYRYGGFIG